MKEYKYIENNSSRRIVAKLALYVTDQLKWCGKMRMHTPSFIRFALALCYRRVMLIINDRYAECDTYTEPVNDRARLMTLFADRK